jgi:hypothetical protein
VRSERHENPIPQGDLLTFVGEDVAREFLNDGIWLTAWLAVVGGLPTSGMSADQAMGVRGDSPRCLHGQGDTSRRRARRTVDFSTVTLLLQCQLTVGACHCLPVAGGARGVTPTGYSGFVVS